MVLLVHQSLIVKKNGYENIITKDRSELDLLDQKKLNYFLEMKTR